VEMENTGADTVFMASLRLQYLRDPLTSVFNFNPGIPVVGLPWLHGQHYLLGSANLAGRAGLSADVSSSNVQLAGSGGILTLYTRGGPILDVIRYGPFGPTVAPPDGYSMSRVGDAWVPSTPTPQRRDGSLILGTNCFAGGLVGDFV